MSDMKIEKQFKHRINNIFHVRGVLCPANLSARTQKFPPSLKSVYLETGVFLSLFLFSSTCFVVVSYMKKDVA